MNLSLENKKRKDLRKLYKKILNKYSDIRFDTFIYARL